MIFDKINSVIGVSYAAFLAASFILSSSCGAVKKNGLEELVLRADLAYDKAQKGNASLKDVLIALKTIDSAFHHERGVNRLDSVSLVTHKEILLRVKAEKAFEYPRYYPDSALKEFCSGLIVETNASDSLKEYAIKAYNHREKYSSDFPFFGIEMSYEYGNYPRIYYRLKALASAESKRLSAFTIKIGNNELVRDRLLVLPQDMSFKHPDDLSNLLTNEGLLTPKKQSFEYVSFHDEVSRDSMFLRLNESSTVLVELKYGNEAIIWQPDKKQKEALVKLIKVFNGMQIIDEKEFLKPSALPAQFPK